MGSSRSILSIDESTHFVALDCHLSLVFHFLMRVSAKKEMKRSRFDLCMN